MRDYDAEAEERIKTLERRIRSLESMCFQYLVDKYGGAQFLEVHANPSEKLFIMGITNSSVKQHEGIVEKIKEKSS